MKRSTLLIILFIFQAKAGKPIQRENGIWYPGKGCGTTTEIKYLHEVPVNTSGLACTFIWNEDPVKASGLCKQVHKGVFSFEGGWKAVGNVNSLYDCIRVCNDHGFCELAQWENKQSDDNPNTCHLKWGNVKKVGTSSVDFGAFLKDCTFHMTGIAAISLISLSIELFEKAIWIFNRSRTMQLSSLWLV